jgi:hypothetical protein
MEVRTLRAVTYGGAILATVMAIAGSASAATATDPRYDLKAHWRLVLKTSSASAAFIAIAASGPRSAWAVGEIRNKTTYLLNWNGTNWRKMALPAHFNPYGVGGSSPSDVYAIGNLTLPDGDTTAEVFRWNGRAWSRALTADAITVIDISSRNVWVDSATGHLDHWDGVTWTRTTYKTAMSGDPYTVAAVGQTLWRTETAVVAGLPHRLVIQRWTGTRWQEVRSPHPAVVAHKLPALSASSADNVWVELPDRSGGTHDTRLLHWNGTTWTWLVWPWNMEGVAAGNFAAAGHSSVWLGSGRLLHDRSGWHISNDGGCGIPVGVPRTNSALCAGTENIIPGSKYYGILSQSGPLP